MDPKEYLKKATELIKAFEKLDIPTDEDGIAILRLFVQAIFPGLTIREFFRY